MGRSNPFERPPLAPKGGSALTALLGKTIFNILGWKVEGTVPNVSKAVFVLAPHTSNWDWVVCVSALLAFRLKASYLAKDTLFRGLLGWIMRSTGGVAVNRAKPDGLAEQIARYFELNPRFWLALTPEGTRGNVNRWKTGFLRIAYSSGAPVVPIVISRSNRCLLFGTALKLTGDIETDLDSAMQHYRKYLPDNVL